MRCLVHSRPDGGVSITYPSPRTFRAITGAGGLLTAYGLAFERALSVMLANGRDERAARRWLRALEHGGRSEADAWALLRWRCVDPTHTAVEVCETDDLPADRWFRNAWRRSPNGGPIWIDLERARPVQRWRIAGALAEENAARSRRLEEPVVVDFSAIRRATQQAESLEQLWAIWPDVLRRAA